MTTVVDIPQDASLVVDFTSVWVASDHSLQYVQYDGGSLLNQVDRAAEDRAGVVGALRAHLKGEHPTTLAE